MIIKIPQGHAGMNVLCRCEGDHTKDDSYPVVTPKGSHDCFSLSSPRLRGYCPPCFEAMYVVEQREHYNALHDAYHDEMTRINGWRIRADRSFERGMASVEGGQASLRPRVREEDLG